LLIEKYFPSARHIEVQILADKHGNSIHLLERECTIQRRYQKIIEESPSTALSPEKRTEICDSALKLCRAISYDNAGTVEFIFNPDGSYFFLEVNTRLQVEHPVTEAVSGIDLVEWQIKIAEGQKLSLNQDDIKHKAYAIECRLYAENPLNNFLPATGKILDFYIPDAMDVRVDSAVETGTEIGIYYDPMIAKIIVSAENRAAAIKKMKYALKNFRCQGLETNQHFLIQLLSNPHFYNGDYDTHFIEKHFAVEEALKISSDTKRSAASALLLYRWYLRNQNRKHINIASGWRNNFYKMQQEIFDCDNEIFQLEYDFKSNTAFEIKSDDKIYQLNLIYCKKNEIRISIDGLQCSYFIATDANVYYVQSLDAPSLAIRAKDRLPAPEREKLKGGYQAPMPGEIVKILVSPNQEVKEGTALLILVSMKMENVVSAAEDGIVEEIYVSEAETVEAGKLLLKINTEIF
jgi:acetyl/propionyl-CoA carboxylase alpha subunit